MALSKIDSPAIATLSDNIAFASGKGLDFSATADSSGTASSEVYSDYEQGTWTGTYGGTTTDPTTAVTSTGTYTKIGNVVYVAITFNNINTTGASGAIQVRGLPYTAVGNNFATGDVMFNLGTDVASSYVNVCVYIPASSTQAVFYATIPNSGWASVSHNAGTGRYTWFTSTYLTNA